MSGRQPVHTVYGGAHLFRADSVPKLGMLAVRGLLETAPDAFAFAEAMDLPEAGRLPASKSDRVSLLRRFARQGEKARRVHSDAYVLWLLYERLLLKLRTRPIEDFRIDFEDGYGFRSDEEEDGHAVASARATADALSDGTLPPSFGFRVKPVSGPHLPRAERTLRIFLQELSETSSGRLPAGFVVTLPKIGHPSEVSAFVRTLASVESASGLPTGSVGVECMVERPALLAGSVPVRALIDAAEGRLRGLHLGLYDYLSAAGIVTSHQAYDHPVADDLRVRTIIAAAGHDLWLSDGATNTIPVPVHRKERLTEREREENRRVVALGWRVVAANVTHSLRMGFTQGWDLHPSQIVPRYAALYAHFLRERDAVTDRLRAFVDAAGQARLTAQQFDDVATGLGLLQFFRRGLACGAFDAADVSRAGLTADEAIAGDIAAIVARRLG